MTPAHVGRDVPALPTTPDTGYRGLVAVSVQHDGAGRKCFFGERRRQRRLPDARFTGEQQTASFAGKSLERDTEHLALRRATDEVRRDRTDARGQRNPYPVLYNRGGPLHPMRTNRLLQTFQSSAPAGAKSNPPRDPVSARTMSVTRISPPPALAHNRAASTTGPRSSRRLPRRRRRAPHRRAPNSDSTASRFRRSNPCWIATAAATASAALERRP